jgi:hypothetical protein
MSYWKHIKQDVVADEHNSSTTNLAVGNSYTFTGTATSTLGVVGIQVSLYADKNCTVYIEQSPDSTPHWDLSDSYNYYANRNFGITVQAISSYVRIRVTSASLTTTTFRLQTALCPIVEAVPRTLDEDGLFQTRISKIKGDMGKVRISPMGAIKTATTVRLAGSTFTTGLDSTYWLSSGTAGAGAVAVANGQMTLTTGTPTVNGAISVNSVRVARYIGGSPNYYRGNVQLPAVTTASAGFVNIRRWGAFDVNDGFFFIATQTNPATTPTLGVVARKTTADTPVSSGSFNGNLGTTYTLDTNVHTYEIWLSNKNVYFFIDDVLLHTITSLTTTASDTLSLKVGLQTINSGDNTAANTLVARSSMIIRLGSLTTQPNYYYFAAGQTAGVNIKVGAGNLLGMTINNVANNAVITLSDSTTAATPVIFLHTAGATSTSAYALDFKGIPFSTGLRLTVASANASVTLFFE